MGAGKTLAIIAGILVILATFVLSWGAGYLNGLAVIGNFSKLFSDFTSLSGILRLVIAILGLISGVLILAGAGSRALAIIGAILPLFIGITLLLAALNMNVIPAIIYDYIDLSVFSGSFVLVAGIIPFYMEVAGFSIGFIVLFAGAVLGLISGFMGREK